MTDGVRYCIKFSVGAQGGRDFLCGQHKGSTRVFRHQLNTVTVAVIEAKLGVTAVRGIAIKGFLV